MTIGEGPDVSAEPEDPWFQPAQAVSEFVDVLCSYDLSSVTEDSLKKLFGEIGRLAAPQWATGLTEDLPPELLATLEDLRLALAVTLSSTSVFDSRRSEYRNIWTEDLSEYATSLLLARMGMERTNYFKQHPIGTPLPDDPAERVLEQQRRAAERSATIKQSEEAIDSLVSPIHQTALIRIEAADSVLAQEEAELEAQEMRRRSESGFPHPGALPYGVSARGAELWVQDLLRHLGVVEAEATQASGDGGVDVVCDEYVVSVKNYAGAVPVEEVREIFAVATVSGKGAALWTSGTLTSSGAEFADLAPVAVVQYNVEAASCIALNAQGVDYLDSLSHGPTAVDT